MLVPVLKRFGAAPDFVEEEVPERLRSASPKREGVRLVERESERELLRESERESLRESKRDDFSPKRLGFAVAPDFPCGVPDDFRGVAPERDDGGRCERGIIPCFL